MDEQIVICGDEWTVVVMEHLYINSEGWGPMRHAFLVDEDFRRILVEKKHLLKNLAAAIEDVILTKSGVVVPLVG